MSRCLTLASVALLCLSANAWSNGLPNLPDTPFGYVDHAVTNLPAHFFGGPGSPVHRDNTPADNPITDRGATLGRTLFYDKRLSHNNSIACASCHSQATGFSDERQTSVGFDGGHTGRHSMAITNTKFYSSGKMFWDERADSVEQQALMPIQDSVEMGMDLTLLNTKLANTTFYGDLFTDAFGDPAITSDRIAKSIAQFVRSLVSYESKFDSAYDANGLPNLEATFTASELRGHDIFNNQGACADCHRSTAQVANEPFNIGLDAVNKDLGAGDGKFKTTSLRNVEVRGRFMHDGRFESLDEVIEFYSTGVKNNPNLAEELKDDFGNPVMLNLTEQDKTDLIAFLKTLTDNNFLTAEMFSDPFSASCDFDTNGVCNIADLNAMLARGPVADGVIAANETEIFDLTGDGQITNDDVQRWLADAAAENGFSEPYLVADANLDGSVDALDFNLWNSHKFTNSLNWDDGDFNGDGVVDVSDWIDWNTNKFQSSAMNPSVVPEPDGWWLCLATLVAVTIIRRRRSSDC